MGDETSQFANRFAAAVERIGELAGGGTRRGSRRPARRGAHAMGTGGVAEALLAIEAVYETRTGGLRDWTEVRGGVLAQVRALRVALERGALPDELRPMARELLKLVEAGKSGP